MRSLARLNHSERLQLLKFVCAAVWADLDVTDAERTFVLGLTLQLDLPPEDMERVEEWLDTPPAAEEVDPTQVPPEHRQLFLEAVEEAITSDGAIDGPERESLRLLRELLS
jgi:uncharacterized tellurite resistance protein B-like protein